MAAKKRKRKPSGLQINKTVIATAKKLKARGILSKNTKLHGGKFISRSVVKKTFEFQHAAALNYKAIKVPKAQAEKARSEGFAIVRGNYIVSPADRKSQNRIKAGDIAGVKPIKGGYIEAIVLPHSIFDIRTLYNSLATGELDKLKLDKEEFAFAFFEHFSYRTFKNTPELLKYLTHYKSIFDAAQDMRADTMGETFRNLQLFRVNSNSISEYNLDGKFRAERTAKRNKTYQDRRNQNESYHFKRLNKMHPDRAMREIKRMNAKAAIYRETLAADPAKLAEYNAKGRKRAKASYAKRKKKS